MGLCGDRAAALLSASHFWICLLDASGSNASGGVGWAERRQGDRKGAQQLRASETLVCDLTLIAHICAHHSFSFRPT